MRFLRIDVNEAWHLLQQTDLKPLLLDIRDPSSFKAAHPKGAFHLSQETLPSFLAQTDEKQPILVICYHGHSSQGVAEYLANQGFKTVYSIDGGFSAWQQAALPLA